MKISTLVIGLTLADNQRARKPSSYQGLKRKTA